MGSKQQVCKTWGWELISSWMSASALISLVTFLVLLHGHPVPTWPLDITLSFIMSSLGNIMKAALIFPVAEAIGQLKWVRFKERERKLSEFQICDEASRGPWGSLLMVLGNSHWQIASLGALIMVTAIALEPFIQQSVTTPIRANTVKSAFLQRAESYSDRNVSDYDGDASNHLDTDMIGAVYSGIFDPDPEVSHISPTCSTGNCTWPEYTSLGVCSHCQRLLPNQASNITGFGGSSYRLKVVANITSTTFSNMQNPILNIYVAGSGDVWECILYFCVKTYQCEVLNGRLDENITSIWPTNNTSKQEVLAAQTLETFGASVVPSLVLRPPKSPISYFVYMETFNKYSRWMSTVFSQEWLITGMDVPKSDVAAAIYHVQQSSLGLSDMIESIASRMTEVIRNRQGRYTSADAAAQAIGSATTLEVYIHVRWAWLVVPFVLVGSSLAFILLTITMTVDEDIKGWKSSSLAVLAHGLDQETRAALLCNGSLPEEVTKTASQLHVQLVSDKDFFCLVRIVEPNLAAAPLPRYEDDVITVSEKAHIPTSSTSLLSTFRDNEPNP